MAFNWTSATADASAAEWATGYVIARIPGSPDLFKEIALADLLYKTSANTFSMGTTSLSAYGSMLRVQGGIETHATQLNVVPAASTPFEIVNRAASAGFDFYVNAGATLAFRIDSAGHSRPGVDNAYTSGSASTRWSVVYAATGTINTSDLRDKTDIEDVPDPLLDAWANVRWVIYRFKDGQRIHAGQVAQWVHKELEKAGIDAFAYGLVGKDEWPAEHEAIYEDVEVEDIELVFEPTGKTVEIDGVECELSQRVEKKTPRIERRDTGKKSVRVKAGNRWNLRPDECQAVEAAWNRREHKRMANRIDQLETRLAALEAGA